MIQSKLAIINFFGTIIKLDSIINKIITKVFAKKVLRISSMTLHDAVTRYEDFPDKFM